MPDSPPTRQETTAFRRQRPRALDYLIALTLSAAYTTLLVATMDMGFTRDEGYYFHAGERYYGWFDELAHNREAGHPEDSFTLESIDRHWWINPEHPVLMKTLFGLSWHTFSQARDWMSPATAMRFPTAVFAGFMVALVFLFCREAFGSRVFALFAAIALGFQPRVFFHSHLACFDAAMATLWLAVVYAYWRSLESRLWAWLAGIFFGLALIVKLNAFFLPLVLLLHWLWAGRRELGFSGRGMGLRLRLPAIPRAFVAMALFGPLIFYVGWPRHWFDTFNRIAWYLDRHLSHEHYYVYYFGKALLRPPFPLEFPLVMTLVTVPLVILATAALGLVPLLGHWWRERRARRAGLAGESFDRRGTGVLIALNLAIPIALIAMPSTPVFGGTKHWMPAMPFLAVLAGAGALWSWQHLRVVLRGWPRLVRAAVLGVFVAALSIAPVGATFSVHPFGTSYYNELIGGVRGAADAEMMRQFWGYASRAALPYLNEVAPERTRVFPHNSNGDAQNWYRIDGLARMDIGDAWTPRRADYAFFHHQKAFVPVLRDIWEAMDTRAPLRVWTVHGVPVFSLYGDEAARQREAAYRAAHP